MSTHNKRSERGRNDPEILLEACPHCGVRLSPWQQVLLKVDRALVCRRCWYRILPDGDRVDAARADSKDGHPKD